MLSLTGRDGPGSANAKQPQGHRAEELAHPRIAQEHPFKSAHGGGWTPGWIAILGSIDDACQDFTGMGSKLVEHRGLVHAGDGAEGRAAFFLGAFAQKVFACVLFKRNRRMAALLRAVMNQPI